MNELEELQNLVNSLCDADSMKSCGVGITFGEIAYIQKLTKEELEELKEKLEAGI